MKNATYRQYRIHPGIGIARLGNSPGDDTPDNYFVGPQVPDPAWLPPDGKYRDGQGNIRREACRFRIYEYSHEVVASYGYGDPGKVRTRVREITDAEAEITWHVHLANRKGFIQGPNQPYQKVPNDPGDKTITGPGRKEAVVGSIFGADVQLGTLITEGDGNLLVLGGFGRSESPDGKPIVGLFSPYWFDDVADGPVRATIRLRDDGSQPAVEPAWVITGVSDFAHPVVNIVTSWDLARYVATQLPPGVRLEPPTQVSFTRDVYPLLRSPVFMQWASSTAHSGHGRGRHGDFLDPQHFNLLKNNDPNPSSPAYQARMGLFRRLKGPSGGGGNMPALFGLTLTPLQYGQLTRWAVGDFAADWNGVPVVKPFAQLTPEEQTVALDKASLWGAVGGSFQPGIETGAILGQTGTYSSPFRIHQSLLPGSLTESLSVPWQADYRACGTGWWPGGRPNVVTADGSNFHNWVPDSWSADAMVGEWWKLGFLREKNPSAPPNDIDVLETERLA